MLHVYTYLLTHTPELTHNTNAQHNAQKKDTSHFQKPHLLLQMEYNLKGMARAKPYTLQYNFSNTVSPDINLTLKHKAKLPLSISLH